MARIRRVVAVKVVIVLFLGVAGVLLPLPRWTVERAMATETRRPVAAGAVVQPAPTPPPPAGASTTAPPPSSVPPGAPDVPAEGEPPVATTGSPTPDGPDTSARPDESVTTSTTTGADAAARGARDRVLVAENTRNFNLIGVTLPATPTSPVLVRSATDDGAWSAWQELVFEPEADLTPVAGATAPTEPDEEAPGAHSDPLWVGDATRYELQLAADDVNAADVHLVYETTHRVAVTETAPAGADPADPAIIPRSSWGARAPKDQPSIASRLQLGIVHHTAGTNAYSAGEVPALLRGVQAYHMDANGWDDIGYNFAVDRFGRIWEARAGGVRNAVIGGHARGFNTGSTGVTVLGNFETTGTNAAINQAISTILVWKFAVHDVDPRTTAAYRAGAGSPRYAPGTVVVLNRIVGHRDVGLTACPGRYLYPYLGQIRNAVVATYPQLSSPGTAIVGNFVGDAPDDVFLRQPGAMSDQLALASGGGFSIRWTFTIGGSYLPVVGDFDGNGYDDIIWYWPGAGSDSLWLSRGDGRFAPSTTSNIGGPYVPIPGDFDGDGDDDVYWYAGGQAKDYLWLFEGGRYRSVATSQVVGSYRPAAGDFDGDGDDDVLWYAPGAAGDALWVSSGARFTTRVAPPVHGSYRPIAGDYDGDGDDDVLWYGVGTRPDNLWVTQGMRFSSRAAPPVNGTYRNNTAGDFDGDGGDDVLWYASPGRDVVWWHTSQIFGRSAGTNIELR